MKVVGAISQKAFIHLHLQVICTVLVGVSGSPFQCFNHPLKPKSMTEKWQRIQNSRYSIPWGFWSSKVLKLLSKKTTQFLKKSAFHNPESSNPKIRVLENQRIPKFAGESNKKMLATKIPTEHFNNPTPLCRACCLLFVAPDGNSTFWEVTHLGSSLGALVFFQPWKSLGPWLPFFVVRLVACRVSPCFSVGVFHHPKEPPFF